MIPSPITLVFERDPAEIAGAANGIQRKRFIMVLRLLIFEQLVLSHVMGFTARTSGAAPPTTVVSRSGSKLANAK